VVTGLLPEPDEPDEPDEPLCGLVRVVTGALVWLEPLEDEPDEPPCGLVRVVTGALVWLEPLEDEPDEPDEPPCGLVRVVTGVPAAAVLPLPEEPDALWPLARVTTPPAAEAEPFEECPCDPLAPVRTPPLELPRPPVATAPRGVGNCPPRSRRTTWTVRRITSVRYCTAGVRAASVATVLFVGCIAYTATPPAATAVIAAAVRVCVLRIRTSRSGSAGTVPTRQSAQAQAPAKVWQR
jgi:hypothetical protein